MGLKLDGIITSEHIDSSGERLLVDGHDISDFENGKAVLNFEHNSDTPEDILGKFIYAKKIFKKADCSNDREKMYWDGVKVPFVYGIAELFDDEGHAGAVAAAAIVRYYHKKKEKILAGFSVEGATLEREKNEEGVLKRTVGRRAALTLRPCNKSCITGVLEDTSIKDAVKKAMGLTEIPDSRLVEVDSIIFADLEKGEKDPFIELKTALESLQKTLTAGGGNVAPSALTGGAALQPEHVIGKKPLDKKKIHTALKIALRDWDRSRPLKESVQAAVKAMLPEVSEDYVDHFTNLAEELSLKKGESPLKRIDHGDSRNLHNDSKQKRLISGLYVDPDKKFKSIELGKEQTHQNPNILKLKNDAGQHVLVKPPMEISKLGNHPDHDTGKAATTYYHMANDFFGLGDHVPVTTHFHHKDLSGNHPRGHSVQATEYVPDAAIGIHPLFGEHLNQARADGTAHKLAMMDLITGGSTDRHMGNLMSTKGGKILHIDNDDAFDYSLDESLPPGHYGPQRTFMKEGSYVPDPNNSLQRDSLHMDAMAWLRDLNPREMAQELHKHGTKKEAIVESVRRLRLLQQMAPQGKSIGDMHNFIAQTKGQAK